MGAMGGGGRGGRDGGVMMQGYTGGPHNVTAYSDSSCTTSIASTSFTVP